MVTLIEKIKIRSKKQKLSQSWPKLKKFLNYPALLKTKTFFSNPVASELMDFAETHTLFLKTGVIQPELDGATGTSLYLFKPRLSLKKTQRYTRRLRFLNTNKRFSTKWARLRKTANFQVYPKHFAAKRHKNKKLFLFSHFKADNSEAQYTKPPYFLTLKEVTFKPPADRSVREYVDGGVLKPNLRRIRYKNKEKLKKILYLVNQKSLHTFNDLTERKYRKKNTLYKNTLNDNIFQQTLIFNLKFARLGRTLNAAKHSLLHNNLKLNTCISALPAQTVVKRGMKPGEFFTSCYPKNMPLFFFKPVLRQPFLPKSYNFQKNVLIKKSPVWHSNILYHHLINKKKQWAFPHLAKRFLKNKTFKPKKFIPVRPNLSKKVKPYSYKLAGYTLKTFPKITRQKSRTVPSNGVAKTYTPLTALKPNMKLKPFKTVTIKSQTSKKLGGRILGLKKHYKTALRAYRSFTNIKKKNRLGFLKSSTNNRKHVFRYTPPYKIKIKFKKFFYNQFIRNEYQLQNSTKHRLNNTTEPLGIEVLNLRSNMYQLRLEGLFSTKHGNFAKEITPKKLTKYVLINKKSAFKQTLYSQQTTKVFTNLQNDYSIIHQDLPKLKILDA